MEKWGVKIGFSNEVVVTKEFDDNITARQLADMLISGGYLDPSDLDDGLTLLPDKKRGEICLVDNSGYPYATLVPMEETTVEKASNQIVDHSASNMPKCPVCGSANLIKQGAMSRGLSGFFFGRHSVEGRAQFICENCDYKF